MAVADGRHWDRGGVGWSLGFHQSSWSGTPMAREPGRLSMQPQEESRCRLAAGAAAYDFEHNFKLQLRHDSETANRCEDDRAGVICFSPR